MTRAEMAIRSHPFYVPALDHYVPLGELESGDILRTQDGGDAEVVELTRRDGEFEVFNIEVAETHNYFVRASGFEGPGVLVHNKPMRNPAYSPGGRSLTADDLGLDPSMVKQLDGNFSIKDGVATARIDMIEGDLGSSGLGAVRSLADTAKAEGATSLRIEGTLANERLAGVLEKRYGMKTASDGATDYIEIALE